ncbi:hypothetical protein WA026_023418 [Henosepilachna vigintioctopunctata]|uniref:Transmembrane protein 126A n=1 Tax=Henosepilachna vigintioctopunctata TaxID=420089 RepID=A0AAW1TYY8_9CUCU
MALIKANYKEIPKDAIVLSEAEAVNYQLKILFNWKNQWEIFGFKYGGIFLSCGAAITGIYVNNHYRQKVKLHTFGKITSYLPICVIPSILAYFLHFQLIIPDMILQKTACPVCLELRSSAIQATVGCLMPTILAPLSSFALAHKYGTSDIPYIHQEPKKLFQLYRKITKPIGNLLFAIFVGHALLGSAVTYAEFRSINKVNQKLAELEYTLEQTSDETKSRNVM